MPPLFPAALDSGRGSKRRNRSARLRNLLQRELLGSELGWSSAAQPDRAGEFALLRVCGDQDVGAMAHSARDDHRIILDVMERAAGVVAYLGENRRRKSLAQHFCGGEVEGNDSHETRARKRRYGRASEHLGDCWRRDEDLMTFGEHGVEQRSARGIV